MLWLGMRRGKGSRKGVKERRSFRRRYSSSTCAKYAARSIQVGVFVRIGADQLAVGGDDVRREKRVDRHPELARQQADASPKCDAADPDRTRVPEADGEPVRAERLRHLDGRESGLGPRGPARDIDLEDRKSVV